MVTIVSIVKNTANMTKELFFSVCAYLLDDSSIGFKKT